MVGKGVAMYKLLIVDDEPIVREGIKNLIPWEDYNFQLVGEAKDGKEGLKKIMELKPDLVLVDIKMPGLSGIELIKTAKEQGHQSKFVILTGYSDFEYAKSAIHLGVRGYLLKPIDELELIEIAKELRAELDEIKYQTAFMNKSEVKAKTELLRRILLIKGDKDTIRKEISQYGMEFNFNVYSVAILLHKGKAEFSYQDTLEDSYLESEIQTNVDIIMMEEHKVFIAKGYSYAQLEEMLKKYNTKCKKIRGESYFITIGHNVHHWWDIHFSYECARMLANYQFLLEDKEIINIHTIEEMELTNEIDILDNKLSDYIEIGDQDEIRSIVKNMKEYFQTHLLYEADIKVKIAHYLLTMHHKFEQQYENLKNDMPDFLHVINEIKGNTTLAAIMDTIYDYSIKMSDIIGNSSTDNVVKRMIAYMEKNYNKDIKLEAIAKMFNYNSAYLGKIFKRQRGDSFNNTLDLIRIHNAKRLLDETDLKVYQVSEQVGYSNIDYFYSKFKKYVGVSPKEYKKK